ncbi:MAG TPA: hypothetical protein VMT51_12505 [Dongiaceae bacterium]|nr:hypothetical protein [Dongiaceae bacterium]
MNKALRAIAIVLCFEMGAFLLYLPWSSLWEHNYFLFHLPSLRMLALHPSVRGLVSGLGVLDIFVAINLLQARSDVPRVAP